MVGAGGLASTRLSRSHRISSREQSRARPCHCNAPAHDEGLFATRAEQPRIQDLAKGGGRFYWRGGTLTMNTCEARGGYEKRGGGGGGGAVRFRPDPKAGGGGGGVLSVLGPI